ncbi:hypothetical protein P7K49_033323 [Saguinus oedipus]|uniref:Uncharacterized protein n=1 Tax=Saguinus oedipus TaxID=9490 RepID=A0ABQ9TRL0_SAGOE|nr:hypothetical protein P7K49_033323 [Saguinus oedipus]
MSLDVNVILFRLKPERLKKRIERDHDTHKTEFPDLSSRVKPIPEQYGLTNQEDPCTLAACWCTRFLESQAEHISCSVQALQPQCIADHACILLICSHKWPFLRFKSSGPGHSSPGKAASPSPHHLLEDVSLVSSPSSSPSPLVLAPEMFY